MRIENINIQNFRQYRDLKFVFPFNADHDLHVIHARNKAGKTNVLNAITWCLYDNEMHLGDKGTASEMLNTQYAQELRNQLNPDGNAIAETKVSITFASDDSSEKIIFTRTCKFNVTQDCILKLPESKFSIMIFHNGEWSTVEQEEETLSIVKKYVPEEIHDYIFFDGEHLENYFKAGQLENVKKGIEELTQAKLLEKAENAFHKYLVGELNPKIENSSFKDISTTQKEISKIQSAIDYAVSTIDSLKTQIHQCDDEISNLENIISGHVHVSEKTARLKEVEKLVDELKNTINQKNGQLKVFIRNSMQSFALYPAIRDLYKYIIEQDKHGKLPPRIDKFLLESIEKHKHCCVCDQPLSEHSFNFIEELKKELEVSSDTSALLNKSVVILRQHLNDISNYPKNRDGLIAELKALTKQRNDYLDEEKQLNTYLMSIPNTEAVTNAIEQKKIYKNKRDELVAKKALEESHKKELDNQYYISSKKLNSLMAKHEQLEKIHKQAEYCKKCRNILREIRLDILEESRTQMESETFDMFKSLMWQKDEYSKVEILEDYTFRLLDKYGAQTLGSCSAAERALLALSFTLALQKVSTHDSLLFIDTPIGRVDDNNRHNFVQTLCDISKSKQVLLTFTPTEYDDNVKAALDNQIASFTKLNKVDGVTIIEK